MFCPKCGNQIPDGATFCPKCGAQLQSRVPGATQTSPATAQRPAGKHAAPTHAAAVTKAAPKPPTAIATRFKPIAIVALICAVIAALSSFMTWAESSSGTRSMSALASSIGVGSQFQSTYSLSEFNDLASDYRSYQSLESSVNDLSSALGMSSSHSSSTTSNAASLFSGIYGAWVVVMIVLVAGIVVYAVWGKKVVLVLGFVAFALLTFVVMTVLGSGGDVTLGGAGSVVGLVAALGGLGCSIAIRTAKK